MRKGRWFGSLDEGGQNSCYNPLSWLVSTAKGRAKRRGIPFSLTVSDLEVPDVCPYLKTPFIPKTMYAMSLDRIDNSKGYVKGNVEVISRKANTMKSNASTEELLEFAYTILERN
jgi:hypothetical protein